MTRLSSERGSALAIAIVLLCLLAMIPIAMQLLKSTSQDTQAQIHQSVEADNAARAGLQDAMSWFQRQACQPVRQSCSVSYAYADAAFNPQFPNDTQDATCSPGPCTTGLVNQFALDPDKGLWARYEVRVQPAGPSNPHAVHDITAQRVPPPSGVAGAGLAWYLESRGYVYWNRNPSVAFNVPPNKVVGNASAATELRRLALVLPAGALIVNDLKNVTLSNNGRAVGGPSAAGVAYYADTSNTLPSVNGQSALNSSGGSYYTGNPNKGLASPPGSYVSDVAIFGMTQQSVKTLADYVVPNVAALPAQYPTLSLVFIDGNADFGAGPQLSGTGILYVNGSLTIESTNNAFFSGLIFATGKITINGPADISGAVVSGACVGGAAAGQCNGGDGVVSGSPFVLIDGTNGAAQVAYDVNILNSIRSSLANYREDKAAYYTFSALK